MPRGDRTGPLGMGPMTGRAAGYCAGYPVPGYMNPYGGRGMAFRRGFRGRGGGQGRGRGFGWFGYPGVSYPSPVKPPPAQPWVDPEPYDEKAELDALHAQAHSLEVMLTDIRNRMEELEKQTSSEKEG